MKKIILIIVCLVIGCAKPKQDPLTLKEINYFNKLGKSCGCVVTRSYDPRPSSQRPDLSEEHEYLLILTDIKQPSFDDTLKLKDLAHKIAFDLKERIIHDKKFTSYSVSFIKNTSSNAITTHNFDFNW